jgi:hypothetical protein
MRLPGRVETKNDCGDWFSGTIALAGAASLTVYRGGFWFEFPVDGSHQALAPGHLVTFEHEDDWLNERPRAVAIRAVADEAELESLVYAMLRSDDSLAKVAAGRIAQLTPSPSSIQRLESWVEAHLHLTKEVAALFWNDVQRDGVLIACFFGEGNDQLVRRFLQEPSAWNSSE